MTHSVTVEQLEPGEIVTGPGGETATFVQRAPHPLYPDLALVVWKMEDGTWMHDALSYQQVVGEVENSDGQERQANLRKALLHRSMW